MLACSFLIESSSLLVTRTGIKAWSSSILGRIRPLILELLALEWRKFHTFELAYLWNQLANLDQILCVASLGVGKGCILFWGRLDQNSDFHGNRKPPLTYNGENGVSTFSGLLLIRSFLARLYESTSRAIAVTTASAFLKMFGQPCDIDLWVMKWRSARPVFHGPVILPYILKTIWCMNIILWDYESVLPDMWPQNKCRSLWPIFHGPVISLISWRLFDVWTSYFGIMSQYDRTFDMKINVGHCDPYFMVQWFCLIFWRLFDVWTSYFGIISQYDTTFDLKINVGHCDLYFMVQWFYLIFWRLFDIWTPYFGIMSQYDPMFDLKIFVAHCDLIMGKMVSPC